MLRTESYPDYTGYIDYLEKNEITPEILNKIIGRHENSRNHMVQLYERYKCYADVLPIALRTPRFVDKTLVDDSGKVIPPLNNRVNNDFFGEINDIMIGYFAGKAASYSYSNDRDAIDETGGTENVDDAKNALSDFVIRNNFYDLNQEATKFASICGYAGRLFYIDTDGNERAMILPPYEAVVLTRDLVQEPEYAVRYYKVEQIDGSELWKAEFYDAANVYYYEGQLGALVFHDKKPHLFDFCPCS